jgi:hypothetical protein
MNSAPIEFHKIWIDQCLATEGIRERFGLDDALNYLIGEKLFSFLHAAERDPLFAAEVPDFIREIRRLLHPKRSAIILIAWKIQNISHLRTRISKWTNSTTQTTNPG